MSDALRRTIRRCVAVTLIPLCLLVLVPIATYRTNHVTLHHPVLVFGDDLALLVMAGALVYLAGSLVVGLRAASGRAPVEQAGDREGHDRTGADHDGTSEDATV
ncbi:MAG: hypothetical protein ABEJ89_10630 [Haloarculaceae archaeon]